MKQFKPFSFFFITLLKLSLFSVAVIVCIELLSTDHPELIFSDYFVGLHFWGNVVGGYLFFLVVFLLPSSLLLTRFVSWKSGAGFFPRIARRQVKPISKTRPFSTIRPLTHKELFDPLTGPLNPDNEWKNRAYRDVRSFYDHPGWFSDNPYERIDSSRH